ncbi:MAG: nitrilase [Actinobacteria bacterium]|nr:nitrilase [Actinomycetota bacterium]
MNDASRSLHVGVAQFASDCGNPDVNLDRHLHWIAEGQKANVELLVCPELSLVGHHGSEQIIADAMRRDDPRLVELAAATGEMGCVVGFIEEGPAAQYYNATALLRDGRVRYVHRKINLAHYGLLDEGKYFSPGRTVDTADLDEDWRMALLICADVWNPALTNLAFAHGATVLVCPVNSGVEAVGVEFDNPAGWTLTMQFYSTMYGAPGIMANRVGSDKGLTFWGGSRIVDAFGRELVVAGDGEELITAVIDFDRVRRSRQLLPTLRDSDLALVHAETTRLLNKLRSSPEGR